MAPMKLGIVGGVGVEGNKEEEGRKKQLVSVYPATSKKGDERRGGGICSASVLCGVCIL